MSEPVEVEVENPMLDDFAAYVAAQEENDAFGGDREGAETPPGPKVLSAGQQEDPEQRAAAALAYLNSEAHRHYREWADNPPGNKSVTGGTDDLRASLAAGLEKLAKHGREVLVSMEEG